MQVTLPPTSGPHSLSASAGPDMPSDEDASADAVSSEDFRRFTVTLDSSRQRNRGKSIGTIRGFVARDSRRIFSFSVLQAQQSNAHVSTSTSMTRPQPAPHSFAVPRRSQLPFQQLDNERAGRVGSDAKKMYSRYADLSERRSAKNQGASSTCKLPEPQCVCNRRKRGKEKRGSSF